MLGPRRPAILTDLRARATAKPRGAAAPLESWPLRSRFLRRGARKGGGSPGLWAQGVFVTPPAPGGEGPRHSNRSALLMIKARKWTRRGLLAALGGLAAHQVWRHG